MSQEDLFRLLLAAVLVGCIGISGFYRSKARKASGTIGRSRESPALIAARLAFTLPLMASLLAYLINPAWMAWAQAPVPAWVRWAGVGLGALCPPLVYWVVSSLGSNISETVLTKETHRLVTHGPYRRVRHPLYSTGILILTSASLVMASWLVAVFTLLAAILILTVVVPAEEKALIAAFGAEYRELQEGTGRILPKLGRR